MNPETQQRPARARAAAAAARGRSAGTPAVRDPADAEPTEAEVVDAGPTDPGVTAVRPTDAGSAGPTRRADARGLVVLGAGLVLGVLVAASLAGGAAAPEVLGDPGPFTRWGLLVSRTVYDLAAIGTLGVLLVAVVLLPRTATGFGPDAARLVRYVAVWSGAWAATALTTALLTLSKIAGVPVTTVLAPDFLPLALDLEQTRALLSTAWLAALVAVGARITRSPGSAVLLLLTGVGALVLPLLTGHAGHGELPALTAAGLALHVAGAAAWVGGLAALTVHLRRSEHSLAAALPRYSRLALACFVTVAASGVLTGWASLSEVQQVWTTSYGRLLLAKVAALVVLGVLGHRHRSRTVDAAVARRPRAFLALAGAELVLMACAAALAVALSHTAPPEDADTHVGAAAPASSVGVSSTSR